MVASSRRHNGAGKSLNRSCLTKRHVGKLLFRIATLRPSPDKVIVTGVAAFERDPADLVAEYTAIGVIVGGHRRKPSLPTSVST